MLRRCVWSRNHVNEEALAQWGAVEPKKIPYKNTLFLFPFKPIFCLYLCYFFTSARFSSKEPTDGTFCGNIICQIYWKQTNVSHLVTPVNYPVSNSKVGATLGLYILSVRNSMDSKFWKCFFRKREPIVLLCLNYYKIILSKTFSLYRRLRLFTIVHITLRPVQSSTCGRVQNIDGKLWVIIFEEIFFVQNFLA